MNETGRAIYHMNPAEDYVIFGDELAEGMLVIREDAGETFAGDSEDVQLRMNRFCRVTRLRRDGPTVTFVGEWVDGYQKVFRLHESYAWIVKRAESSNLGSPA